MFALNVMLFGTGSNVVVTAGIARGVFRRYGLALDLAYTQGSEMLCETLRTGGCDIGVLAATMWCTRSSAGGSTSASSWGFTRASCR